MNADDWIKLAVLVLAGAGALAGSITWVVAYADKKSREMLKALKENSDLLFQEIKDVDDRRSSNNKDLHSKIENTANSLDGKFNVIRSGLDDVKRDYARRDDLAATVERMERASGETREAIAQLGDRIDRGFAAFTQTVTDLALKLATHIGADK